MLLRTEILTRDPAKEFLLLIHGMGMNSTVWKPILHIAGIERIQNKFNIVMVDLPGHGKTPMDIAQKMDPESLARAVCDTLHAEGIDKFHIVGSSLGGWIALEIASAFPQKVLSIVALAPAGLWLQPFTVRYPGTAIARMMANSLKVVSPLLLHYEWARKIGFANVSPRWQKYSYELCLDATKALASAAGYYPAWDSLLKRRFDKEISKQIPVTIIFGDSDKTLPAENCQERSLAPSHADWLIYIACGHAPMWDEPERVVTQIFRTTSLVR